MTDPASYLRRLDPVLRPDPARTVVRPFTPGGEGRVAAIAKRILAYDLDQLDHQFERMDRSIDDSHPGVAAALARRFEEIAPEIDDPDRLDERQRLLIAAYFSTEYAFEAAALFNPSIVADPDQSAAGDGDTRFILSLRGIGEGHVSCVTFRTGCWHADDSVTIDDPHPTGVPPRPAGDRGHDHETRVRLDCGGSRDPSETVLFPMVGSQSRGIEDLRLTPFEDDGRHTFAGTFTALGERDARQWLLWTDNFRDFDMCAIDGPLAEGKGMALFPRKVGGRYAAIARHDSENLFYTTSDDLTRWDGGVRMMTPEFPWECIQIGNCGSPIEIDEGWLMLTHGVGIVRSYALGAVLLDRDDPSKVIGRLRQPLIEADGRESNGYVPNVVYTCGAMLRGRTLLLPYALADEFTRFATVSVDGLVAAMTGEGG